MIIPVWEISDSTESLFRNMIAYEYYLTGSPQRYVTDYVFFMHCLVHSPEDAKLLCRSGIISNFLGADEMVYRVINQLGKNIIISDKFSYSNIFHNVNIHCGRTRNIWMATLRRDYFSSPWALISLLAAITLLVLTIIQTTFAILSYSKSDLDLIIQFFKSINFLAGSQKNQVPIHDGKRSDILIDSPRSINSLRRPILTSSNVSRQSM
ncbi:Plant protein of unknown function (DUF247) [Abeliophyllum distichum]|uniref:Uncharacterized protein n=1 Tax=Abeliophyllum distichum TaxID=126358 RepID=A0ABD1RDL8_9LAMI